MANAKFFKIRWAGEGAPSLPLSFYLAMEGMWVENVYNANGTAIPLDWILEGGETEIRPSKGGGISLVGYPGGPGINGSVTAEISWENGAERNVWFEFLWEGAGFGAVLDALEAAGWVVEFR